jgi:hypothetical protein
MKSLDIRGIFFRAFKTLKIVKCFVTFLLMSVTPQLLVTQSV